VTLLARELSIAPNALQLARRLGAQRPCLFLWSADGRGPSYLAARPLVSHSALDPEPELVAEASVNQLGRAPRWIGVLPYESQRELERARYRPDVERRAPPHVQEPCWFRLGAVACIERRVTVIGDDRASVDELADDLQRSAASAAEVSLAPLASEPVERHGERIRAALELIRAGQIYQVNLARRLDFAVTGRPLDVLEALCRRTRPAYAALLELGDVAVVSTSPELFLRHLPSGVAYTEPIKGTRPRGNDAPSDAALAAELDADPKERAELSMIIDVERNDLGRVSELGSVRVVRPPHVRTQGLVWHRVASIAGRLRRDVSRRELLEAMLPSGSVTGAPKVRAMEIIASLEAERRGLYTGALGLLTHHGELRLAMAIRTLTLQEGVGHYHVGGGIVADSDPTREVEETRWKALQLAALQR
jgi:anthranilate/para-aminobenzoate synthase component I